MFRAPTRHISRVFIHCSASDDQKLVGSRLIEEINAWHIRRGFSGIGYHYAIDKLGAIMEGRSLSIKPAAQKGHNEATIAICVHGLEFGQPFYSSKQADSLRNLCNQIHLAYSGVIAFWPHNAVANKACPVFDVDRVLALDKWRRMT